MDEKPPPYTPVPQEASSSSNASASSPFAAQLSSLRGQILAEQSARSDARDQLDNDTILRIIPLLQRQLDSIPSLHPPPRVVVATFIPEGAVDSSWKWKDDERQSGERSFLIHVESGHDKKPGDAVWSWWRDESMAQRLAKLLQPKQKPAVVNNAAAAAAAAPDRSKGSRRMWSMFKKEEAPVARRAAPADDVAMTARAEVVAFRKPNARGSEDTETGWGIVVRIVIRDG